MTVSVYKYFGDGDSLLYVGITGRRRQRQFEHVSDSIWWHLVFRCEIEHFFDRAMALERERSLIRDLKPRFNVMLSVTRDTRLKAAQDAMKARREQNDREEGITSEMKAEFSAYARELGKKGAQARARQRAAQRVA